MIEPKPLVSELWARYGREGAAPRAFFAPGRVNLIGEHTDYNDGFVLPVALEVGITMVATKRSDRRFRVFGADLHEEAQFDLDSPGPQKTGHWINYIEGVAVALAQKHSLCGADIVFSGDVPSGAGLSSSAAVEMSAGFALLSLSGQTDRSIDRVALAFAGQWAEHHFVGTLCGIMDQLVSARARARHALLVDCRDLSIQDVPLPPKELAILITDTRKKHSLASSEYNTRRQECEEAVARLQTTLGGIRSLRDVVEENLFVNALPDLLLRRARHVVRENARTLLAKKALDEGDFQRLGALFVESHRSLQHDYEVSVAELDFLVDEAIRHPDVLGARMTGGGFGGSTVTLVHAHALEDVKATLGAAYAARFGHEPTFLVTFGGGGARELPLD